jgi:hypothetical protein
MAENEEERRNQENDRFHVIAKQRDTLKGYL